jgi:hypothetical protein
VEADTIIFLVWVNLINGKDVGERVFKRKESTTADRSHHLLITSSTVVFRTAVEATSERMMGV